MVKPHLLFWAGALVLAAGCASPPPPRVPTSAAADTLWLDRLSWGASASDLAAVRAQGRTAWLDAQLAPPTPARLPEAAQAQIQALGVSQQALVPLVQSLEAQRKAADAQADDTAKAAAQKDYQQALSKLAREASARALLNALYSPNQVQEQLAWFWFNHFNVHQYKANLRVMVGDYEQGLRERALGRFRDLLGYTAHHPAMLRYLDNEQNAANHINENYARELLELHTLGINGGYSQRDVQELARVLTGLGVNLTDNRPKLKPAQEALYRRDGLMEFNPARHDFGDKQLLGISVKGRGYAELDQVLDLLARHPSTARFVSRQLAQYFVADEPPPALVERMAARWLQTDGRIVEVMRTMVASPEFEASLGHKFKDPTHYVVSAVRLAYADKVVLNTGPMIGWLYRLGQAPYNRQTPDGYPLDENAWAGPGQMTTRFEIARAIGSGSAGLFKIEGEKQDRPAFPQLANPLYYDGIAPRLAAATKQALGQAASPQEWNTFLLASPELMNR
ncbi:DUF1800 domain-containing protein [Roseateles saccharophilus]|uniref:Uncharacterized protein (DUF1800 family) n=1 Tax=Roseateles saccharophilus TaxID=304 RepID=A0A4R3VF80_ROSSA|nr:DUF1800 domain-containing protein [Roseateles saccharophilus]MDG0833879.1 DUF1800 domain-containing protein [Roseateles saccharophilus]TCV02299.1 uncharacterized protein (DUF1800 family) [Roseateles saccharophilus]